MSNVKWIKIITNMFDNRKIKQIRKLPDGDSLIVVWLQIICLAGQVNDNGMLYFSKDIPYTEDMLAVEFDRHINLIRLALSTFERFKMIEIIDDVLLVSNWEKYQSVDELNKLKEQNRLRQRKFKEKQRLLSESNVTVTLPVTQSNATDIDIDIDKDIYSISKDILVPLDKVTHKWNELNLSQIKSISNNRKKLLQARIKEHGEESIFECIENIKKSSFLKGQNNRNWIITFDWLIRPNNYIKVLEGNYNDRENKSNNNALSEFISEVE